MAAYVAGDQTAFRLLFDRYASPLLRLMARQLVRHEHANDLVQQTFLQVHRARYDFRPDARFRPWLYTIAINLKREHMRQVKRRPEAALDTVPGEGPSQEPLDVARLEAARTLGPALATLPESQREVIVLHWIDGLSFPEIAQVVGATLSAVKVRAHRGYSALRAFLEDDAREDRAEKAE